MCGKTETKTTLVPVFPFASILSVTKINALFFILKPQWFCLITSLLTNETFAKLTTFWCHTTVFSSGAINIFKICPLTSMKVCPENIIAVERRIVNKFEKSYRLGVALEQDFKCLIHWSEVTRNQKYLLTF